MYKRDVPLYIVEFEAIPPFVEATRAVMDELDFITEEEAGRWGGLYGSLNRGGIKYLRAQEDKQRATDGGPTQTASVYLTTTRP